MSADETLIRRSLGAASACPALAEAAKAALLNMDGRDGLDFGYSDGAGQEAVWVAMLYEGRKGSMRAAGFLEMDVSLVRLREAAREVVRLAHVDSSIIMWLRDGDDCPVALFVQKL